MKVHLGVKGLAWCGSNDTNVVKRADFVKASKDNKEMCKSCFQKAFQKTLIVNSPRHETIRLQAEHEDKKDPLGKKFTMKDLIDKWSDEHYFQPDI